MGKAFVLIATLCAVLYLLPTSPDSGAASSAPRDPMAGARGACQILIQRKELEAKRADWGDMSAWSTTDNGDGTVSVGARYAVGDGTRYTVCVLRRDGADWQGLKLSRLQ